MWHQIITAAEPIIVSAAVAVITAVLGVVGAAATQWLAAKRAAIVKQIGADEYSRRLAVARNIWGVVDEEVRTHPEIAKTIEAKQEIFAAKTEQALPGITADEIERLRQTVAGIVNAGKAALTAPAAEPTQASSDTIAPASPAQVPAAAAGAVQQ